MLFILITIILMTVNAQEESNELAWLGGAFLLAGAASVWSVLAMSVKRLHDIGWSVGLIFLLFMPPVAMVTILVLALIPGSQETNQHGPPPFPSEK